MCIKKLVNDFLRSFYLETARQKAASGSRTFGPQSDPRLLRVGKSVCAHRPGNTLLSHAFHTSSAVTAPATSVSLVERELGHSMAELRVKAMLELPVDAQASAASLVREPSAPDRLASHVLRAGAMSHRHSSSGSAGRQRGRLSDGVKLCPWRYHRPQQPARTPFTYTFTRLSPLHDDFPLKPREYEAFSH